MGRKADPRGKDRPRTIVLRGDVADIAQKLADEGILSKTLSELLCAAYGFGDAIDEHKRALARIIEERKALMQSEEQLIATIDALEAKAVEESMTVRPALMKKIEILQARHDKITKDLQRTFDPNARTRKLKQHEETFNLLRHAQQQLEDLN